MPHGAFCPDFTIYIHLTTLHYIIETSSDFVTKQQPEIQLPPRPPLNPCNMFSEAFEQEDA